MMPANTLGDGMSDEILYSCCAKATADEGDGFRRSQNWLLARRAKLYITRSELRCGNWRIPYEQIRDAVLFSFRGSYFIPGYVLKVDTGVATYQFGVNSWGRFWRNDLPFPVRRESGRLAYSPFSVALRLAALSYLAYWVWSRFL
jgi:hypothetical protein